MARSEDLNRQMRDTSRRKILRAALQVFGQHGFDGASIRMIADRADISVGLLYNYFPGKTDVLAALFEESMRDVQASFSLADAATSADQRIERLVRGSFEMLRRNRDFWRLSYGVRMQPAVLASLGKRIREWTRTIQATLTRYLRDAGSPDPQLDAAVLFAVIDGVAQHYVLDPRHYPLDDVADRIVAMFGRRRHG